MASQKYELFPIITDCQLCEISLKQSLLNERLDLDNENNMQGTYSSTWK